MKIQAWLGPLVLIGLGALLLANNLAWEIPFRHLIRDWWPLAVIGVGLASMTQSLERRQSLFGGLAIALIGVAFLVRNLNPDFSIGYLVRTYWPVLLIAGGLSQLAMMNGWRGSRPSNPN